MGLESTATPGNSQKRFTSRSRIQSVDWWMRPSAVKPIWTPILSAKAKIDTVTDELSQSLIPGSFGVQQICRGPIPRP